MRWIILKPISKRSKPRMTNQKGKRQLNPKKNLKKAKKILKKNIPSTDTTNSRLNS